MKFLLRYFFKVFFAHDFYFYFQVLQTNKIFSTHLYDFRYYLSNNSVWFGLVLRHVKNCWLFNTKSILICIDSSISNNSH